MKFIYNNDATTAWFKFAHWGPKVPPVKCPWEYFSQILTALLLSPKIDVIHKDVNLLPK